MAGRAIMERLGGAPLRRGPGGGRRLLAGWALRLPTAAALAVDAVVHLRDAYFYDANAGALLTEGELFRIQAGVAIAVAVLVLAWPRWPSWLLALLVTASAAAAVVAWTYLDIGPFAGLPGMYEPSWGPPGKAASAWAEGAGAILSLAGLGWALAGARVSRTAARGRGRSR